MVILVVCFGAGLMTGLLRFWGPLTVAALLAMALLLCRRDAMLFPLAALLGLAHGALARSRAGETCAARLPPGDVVATVRLVEPARPGQPVLAESLSGCRGGLMLRWSDAALREAGQAVRVTGRWVPRSRFAGRADGVLVVRSMQDLAAQAPTPSHRLRSWIVATSDRLFGARAPMVDALVLGRRGGLDPELRESFVRSGLVHILAISGFHVGLLTGWVVLVLRSARLGQVRALVTGAVGGLTYVAFLGWPPPATRAALLGSVLAIGFLRQRRVQPAALLAVTGLGVMVIDPWAVTEPGAWLSAAAIAGLTTATRWSDRRVGRSSLARTLAGSVGATLATAPITAWVFGTAAWIGILLNVVAIPLAAVAVPGILLTLLAAPAAPLLAGRFAAGTGLALAGLERVAMLGSRVPGGAWVGEPGWRGALPWAIAMSLALWVVSDQAPAGLAARRAVWLAAIGLWGALLLPQIPRLGGGQGELTLFLLSVGQGDAAALRTPEGRWVLIDAGPVTRRSDAGRRIVAPFLARHGVARVEALVLSHAHLDHLGGAGAILDRFPVSAAIEPALPVPDSVYLALLDRVAADGVRWHPARRGTTWQLDRVRFTVLHPDTAWSGWREDLNEDSLVLLVEYGGFRAVFAGDAGFPAETALSGLVGRVDLLKAGHHGSRTATGHPWLAELQPRAVVLSLGSNRYGHPAPATLERIRASGAALWRTDRDGTVEVRTDGRRVRVRGRWRTDAWPVHPSALFPGPSNPQGTP